MEIISTYAEGKIKTKVPDHDIWQFVISNSNLGCPGGFMSQTFAILHIIPKGLYTFGEMIL